MSSNSSSSGIGFTGALQITFIVLKLMEEIDWSWFWVLTPTWITAIVFVVVCLVVFFWMD